MKILVTGPRGFVGARIMDEFPDAVPAPSLRGADRDAIRRLVDETEPDVILHTAAMSDIRTCENDPEGSWRANVEIPVWLAECGVKTVIYSTDQVYSALQQGTSKNSRGICKEEQDSNRKRQMRSMTPDYYDYCRREMIE